MFIRWRKQQERSRKRAVWLALEGGEMRLVVAGIVSVHSLDGLLGQARKSGFC